MDNINLGSIISNDFARKVIYATYAVAVIVAGGLQVWFSSVDGVIPGWLDGALNVLAYLGVPIGGLALANTSNHGPVIVAGESPAS